MTSFLTVVTGLFSIIRLVTRDDGIIISDCTCILFAERIFDDMRAVVDVTEKERVKNKAKINKSS